MYERKKRKHPFLFQYKLSYKNEIGTNHHGLFSSSIWCFKIFLRGPSFLRGGLNLTLIFSMWTPSHTFQLKNKRTLKNCFKNNWNIFWLGVWKFLFCILCKINYRETMLPRWLRKTDNFMNSLWGVKIVSVALICTFLKIHTEV